MRDEDKLRKQRLVFYSEDMEKIDRYMQEFLKLAGAKCAILVDKEGHMVTKAGHTDDFDMQNLFQTATTGAPSEYAQIEETMSPVALETMSAWILERVR